MNRPRRGVEGAWLVSRKRDEDRNIGLGPEHDWASHGADAAGLMAVAYEEPKANDNTKFVPRENSLMNRSAAIPIVFDLVKGLRATAISSRPTAFGPWNTDGIMRDAL